MIIDVLITGSSRFEDFKKTIKSFLDKVSSKDGYRLHLHEDVVNKDESNRILHWSQGVFENVIHSDPRIGRPAALTKLKGFVKSTYFVYLEQDWEFIKPVNLDDLRMFMGNNYKVRQVAFGDSRQPNNPVWESKVYKDLTFWRSKYWFMSPALWRTSFVMQRWDLFVPPLSGVNFNHSIIDEFGKFQTGVRTVGEDNEYIRHLGPEKETPGVWL